LLLFIQQTVTSHSSDVPQLHVAFKALSASNLVTILYTMVGS